MQILLKDISMIRKLAKEEYNNAADLSYKVCMECGISDFTQKGIETFKSFIYDTSLMNELDLYGAFDNNLLIGVIGLNRKRQHISLFFILPKYHRKGIGKSLFNHMMNDCDFTKITVNSSTYGEAFYKHVGFKKVKEGSFNQGIMSIPMIKECMKTDFTTRTAELSDASELRDLFRETVLTINKRDYSQAEVEDWASCGNDLSRIKEMIRTHYFIVATNRQAQIVGFSSITTQGYLHSMFVHKDFQGKGIATMLLNEIEQHATATGIKRITSEVSLTARPFFEKRGYIVEKEQKRKANQLSLTNFWMAKE